MVKPERSVFYSPALTPELAAALERADGLNARITALAAGRAGLMDAIRQKLRVRWTYDSNAIEGSSLTLAETHFLLQEGKTTSGKPFKDYLDARNHAEAIDLAYDAVRDGLAADEALLKRIHAILLSGVSHVTARDPFGNVFKEETFPGQYKKHPNQAILPDGAIHRYVEPRHVAEQMAELSAWVRDNLGTAHPAATCAVAHYNLARIHPFDDGNGRAARLFMNLILMKKGFPPAIIQNAERPRYIEALMAADSGELGVFIGFVVHSLVRTQESILADLDAAKEAR